MKKVVYVHKTDCNWDFHHNCYCDGWEFEITPEQEALLRESDPDNKPIENWPLTASETLEMMYETEER